MKKWFLHILLLVGTLGMLTTSCSQEADDPTQTPESRKAQVVFTIALDDVSAASRGTWGDNLDDVTDNDYESAIGNSFDNYINPNNFHVQLVIGGTTYTVQNLVHWQTGTNEYEFVGEVDVEVTSASAKIMVFANMSPSATSFSTDYDTHPNGVAYIPMCGVQTTTLSLTPGSRTVLEDPIYLLRAMAKVEVELTAEGYTLESLSLNRHNTKGNCLPANWSNVDNTKELEWEGSTANCFNANTTDASTDNLVFTVTDNHLVYYLPEVENAEGDDELVMTVTLKKGDETVTLSKPYLYFRTYDNGSAGATPYNVVRNHWYKYNITKISDGANLEVIIEINPWNYRDVTYPNTPLT